MKAVTERGNIYTVTATESIIAMNKVTDVSAKAPSAPAHEMFFLP